MKAMKRLPSITILDWFAIAVSAAAVALFSWFAYTGHVLSDTVVIQVSGEKWLYPLDVNRRQAVPGPLGDTIVVIEDGRARVEESPCRNKLCIHMPPISKPGQWIACLPNTVFVSIKGRDDQETDQVAY
jgi:hypothetical protein